jgi:DNA repair exonuclease SbcCD ATPase subunit
MTPKRLYLKGFLSFRDEATLEFEPDQILSLNGPNGAGKSTIFDAMLFALFGGHRAGKEPSLDLLHKECDEALVRFDFRLTDGTYRIERGLRRKSPRKGGKPTAESTRLVYAANDAGEFQPVENTHRDTGCKEWVQEHVGLTYDAFISSVLLMQGRAEALTNQDYEAAQLRFQVLSRVVGLEFYQRLHKAVSSREDHLESERDRLTGELQGMEEVSDEKLTLLSERIQAATAAYDQHRADVGALEQRLQRAQDWARLLVDSTDAQRKLDEANALVGEREKIESEGRRTQELTAVLPDLAAIDRLRRDEEAERRSLDEMTARCQSAAGMAEKLCNQVETAKMQRTDLEAKLESARQDWQRLTSEHNALKSVSTPLQRLHRDRAKLGFERTKLVTVQQTLREAQSAARDASTTAAEMESRQTELESKSRDALQAFTKSETTLTATRQRALQFVAISGEKACSQCGQELTPEHVAQELERIAAKEAHDLAEFQSADGNRKTRERELGQMKKALTTARQSEKSASEKVQTLRTDERLATKSVSDLEAALHEVFIELPLDWQQRIAEREPAAWESTTYPKEADLQSIDALLRDLQARIDSATAIGKTLKTELDRHVNDLNRLTAEHATARNCLNSLDTDQKLSAQRIESFSLQRLQARERLPVQVRIFSDTMSALDLHQWQDEFERLKKEGAVERWEKLKSAEAGIGVLRERFQDLTCRCDTVLAADRVSVDSVAAQLKTTRQSMTEASQRLAVQQNDKERLESIKTKYRETHRKMREAESARKLHERLAELLSEKQLQRILLKKAEEGIVENANHVLDRLAGGQMTLRLVADDDNRRNQALKLEVFKPRDQHTFNLAHLSNSERFRVAVSLALGIGQYASRLHRPIDSVMIDEGFGCLDPNNRRTMIEEIAQLRGQLQCIILVSHQEDFVEAFPRGYRFRKENNTTIVEPIVG